MRAKSILAVLFLAGLASGPTHADVVYAAVQDGALNAVAMFTPTLGFISQVATDGPIRGIAAGANDIFYVSVGNHTDEYDSSGTLLHTIAGSPTTVTRAMSYGNSFVYAALTDGALNAVALFTPSLGFVNQLVTDGPILGLTAGADDDFYVSVGNHADHYNDAGTLLGMISGSPTTVTRALSYGNSFVYAALTDGALNAVALFTPSLGFVNQLVTDGPILGLTAGADDDFYVSVGNHVDHYNDAGTLLGMISGSPTTVTPALAYYTTPSAVVPEPSSLALALLSLGMLGFSVRPGFAMRSRRSGTRNCK